METGEKQAKLGMAKVTLGASSSGEKPFTRSQNMEREEKRESPKAILKGSPSGKQKNKGKREKCTVEDDDEPIKKQITNRSDMKRLMYRCSPRALHETCVKFNAAQRKSVYDMGFGAVIENAVRDIPTTIAHWCVSRYNPKNTRFELPNGNNLDIEAEDVWLVLGLPKGEVSMKRNKKLIGNKLAVGNQIMQGGWEACENKETLLTPCFEMLKVETGSSLTSY